MNEAAPHSLRVMSWLEWRGRRERIQVTSPIVCKIKKSSSSKLRRRMNLNRLAWAAMQAMVADRLASGDELCDIWIDRSTDKQSYPQFDSLPLPYPWLHSGLMGYSKRKLPLDSCTLVINQPSLLLINDKPVEYRLVNLQTGAIQ